MTHPGQGQPFKGYGAPIGWGTPRIRAGVLSPHWVRSNLTPPRGDVSVPTGRPMGGFCRVWHVKPGIMSYGPAPAWMGLSGS